MWLKQLSWPVSELLMTYITALNRSELCLPYKVMQAEYSSVHNLENKPKG